MLVLVFEYVALVVSAAFAVVFLYLNFVVGLSVVMLVRQVLSTVRGKEPPEQQGDSA